MQLISDEEILYTVGTRTALNYAAADIADMLGAKYAFQVNTQNSELRISAAARSKAYFALADRLRANGPGELPGGENNGGLLAEGFFGGTSAAQNEALLSVEDNVPADVRVGQDDFYEHESDPTRYFRD